MLSNKRLTDKFYSKSKRNLRKVWVDYTCNGNTAILKALCRLRFCLANVLCVEKVKIQKKATKTKKKTAKNEWIK